MKTIRLGRLYMEVYLGRPLTPDENVHHIDGDTLNNAIENLQIVSRSEHMGLHMKVCSLGNTNRRGKHQPHSEEENEKNRQAHLGKVTSEETKEKIRQGMKESWEKRKRNASNTWGSP